MKELEKALSELGKQAGFKALLGALRDSSKPILKAARNSAPSKSGALRKGIRTQTFRGKGKSDSVATLHMGFHRKTAWYGQILERGAKKHAIKAKPTRVKNKPGAALKIGDRYLSSVSHPGTSPKPMLTKSFQANYPQAIKILKQRLKERIITETIKKYGKGTRKAA